MWTGDLIVEGGGFCGARTLPMQLDLSGYDGVTMRISGDGQTFKLNIKTVSWRPLPHGVRAGAGTLFTRGGV